MSRNVKGRVVLLGCGGKAGPTSDRSRSLCVSVSAAIIVNWCDERKHHRGTLFILDWSGLNLFVNVTFLKVQTMAGLYGKTEINSVFLGLSSL